MKIDFTSLYTKIALVILFFPNTNFAQDKLKINHEAYDNWKSIKSNILSPKGTFVVYTSVSKKTM